MKICSCVGLKGFGPASKNTDPLGADWVDANEQIWKLWTAKNVVRVDILKGTHWGIMRGSVDFSTFDSHFDTSGAGGIGLNEEMDTVRSNHLAFDRMKEATLLPA